MISGGSKRICFFLVQFFNSRAFILQTRANRSSLSTIKVPFTVSAMHGSAAGSSKDFPAGCDLTMEEEYASLSKLLVEFMNISKIDRAWVCKSDTGKAVNIPFVFHRVVLGDCICAFCKYL